MSSVPPPLPPNASTGNPYAAPTARIVDVGENADLVLADRGTRLGAAILDSIVAIGPMAILIGIGAATAFSTRGSSTPTTGTAVFFGLFGIIGIVAMIAVLVVNFVWLHRYGQTVAKRWLGIKIVRTDGSRCGLTRVIFARWLPVAVINWVLGLIPLLGFFVGFVDPLMIFRDDRRCLHDLIADTVVVKA